MKPVVRLGFEVGTGRPVDVPLAHTFVTGQTQLSGKTTTLRAIVERSGCRALVFITKRGESFDGRRIAPYLPREGDQPIHWRLVETILAAALGQRSMKYERLQLVNAVKSPRVATSLQEVRNNVAKLQEKAKGKPSGDIYLLIGEYLDLVLPEMKALGASDALELEPGLNVMDLSNVGQQLQALVIRASLEQINRHEHGVLTVFPEAWEFAPRNTNGPAKEPAIAMARKGAVLGNFLLCDSQDIAGVDTVIRQAASVWILGVQRELNELKRTIQTIPAGIRRPKPEDVATLQVGQFYVCWGSHAVKMYVWPAWMTAAQAEQVATGQLNADTAARLSPRPTERRPAEEPTVKESEARELRETNKRLDRELSETREKLTDANDRNEELERRLDALEQRDRAPSSSQKVPESAPASGHPKRETSVEPRQGQPIGDEDELYRRFKARLVQEVPKILKVLATAPELRVEAVREVIEVDGKTPKGRIARLIAKGWFDGEGKTQGGTRSELARTGADVNSGNISTIFSGLVKDGFLTAENGNLYRAVPGMKVNIVER